MPTVYQVQQTGFRDHKTGEFLYHDVTPALRYGELKTLLPSRGGDPALAPAPMIDQLRHGLRDFSPDDYLLPMGSPAALVAAGIIASRNAAGRVQTLVWDKREKQYYVSKLEL